MVLSQRHLIISSAAVVIPALLSVRHGHLSFSHRLKVKQVDACLNWRKVKLTRGERRRRRCAANSCDRFLRLWRDGIGLDGSEQLFDATVGECGFNDGFWVRLQKLFRRVASSVLEDQSFTAWVVGSKLSEVVDIVANDHPRVVLRGVLRDLFVTNITQADRAGRRCRQRSAAEILHNHWACVVAALRVVPVVAAITQRKLLRVEAAAKLHRALRSHRVLQVLNVEDIHHLARVVRRHVRGHTVVVGTWPAHGLGPLGVGQLRLELEVRALLCRQPRLQHHGAGVVAGQLVVFDVRAVAEWERRGLVAAAQLCHAVRRDLGSELFDVHHIDTLAGAIRRHVRRDVIVVRRRG